MQDYDGLKKNQNKTNSRSFFPKAVEVTIPRYFSIYPSEAVPMVKAHKIPFFPWQVKALVQVFLSGMWRCSCFQHYVHNKALS
jgi:hypothetical protein